MFDFLDGMGTTAHAGRWVFESGNNNPAVGASYAMGDGILVDFESSAPVILIVEDEWLVREEIAGEFRRSGWTVLEASTGEAAIGLLQVKPPVDALITDIQLAGRVTGWDVAEAYRAKRPDIPIVYTSGNAVDDSRLVSGSTFVAKPCPADELMDACRRCDTRAAA